MGGISRRPCASRRFLSVGNRALANLRSQCHHEALPTQFAPHRSGSAGHSRPRGVSLIHVIIVKEAGVTNTAVAVTLEPGHHGEQRAILELPEGGSPFCLSQMLPLTAGMSVRVDPAKPAIWQAVSIAPVGDGCAPPGRRPGGRRPGPEVFDSAVRGGGSAVLHPTSRPDLGSSWRWHRMAAVDALDRWLQLPLNPSLITAERGLARAQTALILADGPLRSELLHDALGLARGACYGLESYFQRLTGPVPEGLAAGLRRMVEGYRTLAGLAPEPEDLQTVVRVGRKALDAAARNARRMAPAAHDPESRRGGQGTSVASLIDPRQVPARVLELSNDPAMGEVLARPALVNGIPVLDVEVPAFGALAEPVPIGNIRDRLLARFVDRLTGEVHAQLALTIDTRPGSGEGPDKCEVFHARLPLGDLDPAGLRVDVVDADIDLPPIRSDFDPQLLSLRRAMVFLREWRSLVASVRLGTVTQDDAVQRARSLSRRSRGECR